MVEANEAVSPATTPAMPGGSAAARERRRSPLAGVGAEQLASLPASAAAHEVPFLVMASLRLDPSGPGRAPIEKALGASLPGANAFTVMGTRHVVWIGPDEWLVLGPDGDEDLLPTLEKAAEGQFVSVVDVSGQRTAVDLSGEKARDLLAHGMAMDLHASAAPTGTAATTVLALAGVTLLVLDDGTDGGTTTFRLLLRSSFARYTADWLADAAVELRS